MNQKEKWAQTAFLTMKAMTSESLYSDNNICCNDEVYSSHFHSCKSSTYLLHNKYLSSNYGNVGIPQNSMQRFGTLEIPLIRCIALEVALPLR